jgi:hypothetical protein
LTIYIGPIWLGIQGKSIWLGVQAYKANANLKYVPRYSPILYNPPAYSRSGRITNVESRDKIEISK